MNKRIVLAQIVLVVVTILLLLFALAIEVNHPSEHSAPSDEPQVWYNATYQLESRTDMNVSVQFIISTANWSSFGDPITVLPGEARNFTLKWPDATQAVVLVYVYDQSNYIRFNKWYLYTSDMMQSQVIQ